MPNVQVPIVEVPGLLSPMAAQEWPLSSIGASCTLSRLHLSVLEAPSGGTVVARIGTGPAGGGSGIATTIADGTLSNVATGSISLTGSELLYFRLASATDPASDLSGWFELVFADTAQPSTCAGEPVTIDEAKLYLRVDTTADDNLICALLHAARFTAEAYTARSFLTQTRFHYLDRWPGAPVPWWDGVRERPLSDLTAEARPINLPYGPVTAVTAVRLLAEDGTKTAVDAALYYLDTTRDRIVLRRGCVWPVPLRDFQAIEVEYATGYGTSASVPAPIKQGILVHVAQMYENRENPDLPAGARVLYQPFRVLRLS